MIDNVEMRGYDLDIEKRDGENGNSVIEGVAVVYDKQTDLGEWYEVVDKGALDGTDLKDVRLMLNHDTTQLPLARSRNNNEHSTMRLNNEADGLHFKASLDTENNAQARAAKSAVDRGDVSGCSFMFAVDSDKWEDLDSKKPTRHITAVGKIFELSICTFPAYEQTSVFSRSIESARKSLESAKKALESARQRAARIEELNKRLEVLNHDKGIQRNHGRTGKD